MSQMPSKEEILHWISENPTETSKRDISRAFGIKGAARIDLKRLLKELEAEGHLAKRKKTYRDPDKLPPVSVLQVTAATADGDLTARPMEWQGEAEEPRILIIPRASDPALGEGDRILARLTETTGEFAYEARLIRRIGTNPHLVLGIVRMTPEGGRIQPIDKGAGQRMAGGQGRSRWCQRGRIGRGRTIRPPQGRMGLPRARIVNRLGDPSQPKAVSLIAIHQHGIPHDFPDEVIAEADAMQPATLARAKT